MDGNGRGGIQDGRIVISTVQVEKFCISPRTFGDDIHPVFVHSIKNYQQRKNG